MIGYLQHADVLVVPHVVTSFTDSLDPIKLYEYQAVGRPVVSTPVAGFRDADDPRIDDRGRRVSSSRPCAAAVSASDQREASPGSTSPIGRIACARWLSSSPGSAHGDPITPVDGQTPPRTPARCDNAYADVQTESIGR